MKSVSTTLNTVFHIGTTHPLQYTVETVQCLHSNPDVCLCNAYTLNRLSLHVLVCHSHVTHMFITCSSCVDHMLVIHMLFFESSCHSPE